MLTLVAILVGIALSLQVYHILINQKPYKPTQLSYTLEEVEDNMKKQWKINLRWVPGKNATKQTIEVADGTYRTPTEVDGITKKCSFYMDENQKAVVTIVSQNEYNESPPARITIVTGSFAEHIIPDPPTSLTYTAEIVEN